jgi:hypothetical protein
MRFTFFCSYVPICLLFHYTINRVSAGESDAPLTPFEATYSVMGCVKTIRSDRPIAETLTDAASIALAHANPVYCNVGRLWLRTGEILKNGAAVYLGGRTCVTAAHCLVNESGDVFKSFNISFELSNGEIVQYEIAEIIVHPLFLPLKEYDIAVVKLKESVRGLTGALVNYAYGKKEMVIRTLPEMTMVGYCGSYSDLSYRQRCDFKRRATQSLFFSVESEPIGLLPIPHRLDIVERREPSLMNCFSEVVCVSRPALPYELGIKHGMSGGGTFEGDYLVGINMAYTDRYEWWFSPYAKYWIPEIDSWLNCFRYCFDIPHIRLPENMFEGRVAIVMPLGAVEEWLEEWRRTFDGELKVVLSP